MEAILSLCWLPFNWINSAGKKDATDLCTGYTYEGSGSCAVFIPANMEQFSPEHFQYLQWSLMLLRCFFCQNLPWLDGLLFDLLAVFAQSIFTFLLHLFSILSMGYHLLISSMRHEVNTISELIMV